jgi:hypothetical protein
MPIALQMRQQIEVFIAGPNLEADARSAIALEDQLALAQDAVDQIDRRPIQHHQIDPTSEFGTQPIGKIEVQPLQRRRRVGCEQDRKIEIACRPCPPARLAPEQIGATQIL